MKNYYVYILASNRNGTLYVGVTNDLMRRTYEHGEKQTNSFSKKYDVCRLVYFEQANDIEAALWREKNLKSWNRSWKIALIEEKNPEWSDLSVDLL